MLFSGPKTKQFFSNINDEVIDEVVGQRAQYLIPSSSTSSHPLYEEETSDTQYIKVAIMNIFILTQTEFFRDWTNIGADAESELQLFVHDNQLGSNNLTEIEQGSVFGVGGNKYYRVKNTYDSSDYTYDFGENGLTSPYDFYTICDCQLCSKNIGDMIIE